MIPTLAGAFGSTPIFNEATGGTVTTFSSGGKNYKRHVFLSGGTFTVTRSVLPFIVTVVGGGGGGGAGPDGFGTAGPGGPGGFYSAETSLTIGTKTVSIGGGGGDSGCMRIGGGGCGVGGQGGSSSITGAWTAGGGSGGAGFGCSTGAVGIGSPSPAANGGVTARDNAAHGLSTSVGNGGAGAQGPYPSGPCSTSGLSGAVVVEYQIV
jgi:hypothetical protein